MTPGNTSGVFFQQLKPGTNKMGRQAHNTGHKVAHAINTAIATGQSEPLVYTPPGRKTQTAVTTRVKTVQQQLIRIEHDADPLGFLIHALHGAVFDVQIVTPEGQIITIKEQVSLKDRVKIAMFLANKQLPSMTLTKVIAPEPGSGKDGSGNSGMSFAQMVARAAHAGSAPKQPVTIDVESDE